jgi:hypothetical protein
MKIANQSPVTPLGLPTAKPRSLAWVWLRRGLLGLLIFIVALLVVGATYQRARPLLPNALQAGKFLENYTI